ncbi:hypothetical protein ABPG75_002108 [Micractinium tetrahymenae]
MAAAEHAKGAWGHLPFDAAAAIVATLHTLPRHQALAAFAALRRTSRHWRHAVDDALQHWEAPPALLAGHAAAADAHALQTLLRRFRALRALTLDWCTAEGWGEDEQAPPPTLGTAALQALASLRRLETLSLRGCRPTAALFYAVAALPSLHSLSFEPGTSDACLTSSGSTSSGLAGDPGASPAPLAGCSALTSLELQSLNAAGVEADVVAVLRGATRLRHLALYRTVRATAALAQQSFDIGFAAPRLTALSLRCTFTADDAFDQLFSQLSCLRRLDISGSRNLTDDGFRGITCLAGSLTALALQGGHEVGPDGATALAWLTSLRHLDLGFSNQMSGDYLLPLIAGSLAQLTLLDIRGCSRACSPHAFEHISRLSQLQHLSAQGCRLGPTAVPILAHLGSLRHLDIVDNPRLGSLEALTSLRQLAFLDASECGLGDAHVETLLASLPQVCTVLLSANAGLTTAVLEALAAGPARCTLQVLSATELCSLDCEELPRLLPQLGALRELDLSAAMCQGGSLADGEALLAAAEAAPALHTLTARSLKPLPAQEWRQLVQAGAARRRLLQVIT